MVLIFMNYEIVKGKKENLKECCEILIDSEIGRIYFAEKNITRIINNALESEEIYVAINEYGKCLGFIWYAIEGAFQKFPYLHVIILEKSLRGMGIGKELINYFEKIICEKYEKVFLMVGDFNHRAKKLYEELGYKEIGIIPDFYKDGYNEHLMMKNKKYF